jgi:error-prone DNA polymerase
VSSIVCYLTGLSHVDPIENDLFLGRFLNEELSALPDIDLDFPRDIREVLIPRVHERYGHDRSALVAAFATYRRGRRSATSARRSACAPEIERVARAVDPWARARHRARRHRAIGRPSAASPRWRALVELVAEAASAAAPLSQHSGGMVISPRSRRRLPDRAAAMEGARWSSGTRSRAGRRAS